MTALQTLLILFGLLNLPFAVFLYIHSDKRPATTFYVLISVFASLWSISTFLTAVALPGVFIRYALYGHYIFGYLAYLSFFWFALYFPVRPRRLLSVGMGVFVTLFSIILLALIPTYDSIFTFLSSGHTLAEKVLFNIRGYVVFILALSGVFFTGLALLIWKLRSAPVADASGLSANQIYFAILSNLVAGTLGIVLNLVLPLYGNFSFFYINPVFVTCALIAIGFYNLLAYHLFQAKVVLTEFFAAGIWVLSFTQLVSGRAGELWSNVIVFVASIVFGIFLIDSVLREVRQRERIEKLAEELAATNERQEGLIHFIGHEVKGFLTKAEGAFAALLEGDFGTLPEGMRPFVTEALRQTREGVTSVSDILQAANQKRGTITYQKEPFDLGKLVIEHVEHARAAAEQKKLDLKLYLDETATYPFTGDKAQIAEHVLRNLLDNAVAYTPAGAIEVRLEKVAGPASGLDARAYRLSVKDTGVGISEGDKRRLFTEGGHGKESQKVNVHSTGYGLYIAKNIVEHHGGAIRAESEGPGKGTTFIVELPMSPPGG